MAPTSQLLSGVQFTEGNQKWPSGLVEHDNVRSAIVGVLCCGSLERANFRGSERTSYSHCASSVIAIGKTGHVVCVPEFWRVHAGWYRGDELIRVHYTKNDI